MHATAADLVRMLGERLAVQLIAIHGGLRIYVPKAGEPTGDARAVRVLLGDRWSALVDAYGGGPVVLPRRIGDDLAARDACIRDARARGELVNAVAARYRLTRRRVQQIAARGAAEALFRGGRGETLHLPFCAAGTEDAGE